MVATYYFGSVYMVLDKNNGGSGQKKSFHCRYEMTLLSGRVLDSR